MARYSNEFKSQILKEVEETVDCAPVMDSLGANLYEARNASFIKQVFPC
jgi:hypothetical protein